MKTAILPLFVLFVVSPQNEAKSLPLPSDSARMARYIMHNTDWMSIATISTSLELSKGYPFANLKSTSDGPISESSGVPYMLLTGLEWTAKDAAINNNVGLMASLAQTGYCQEQNLDPQDPRCGRLIITGKLVKVEETSPEYAFAKNALISRHPAMEQWMKLNISPAHNFYIAKVDIEQVIVMSELQGSKSVNLLDYKRVSLNEDEPSSTSISTPQL